MVSTGAKRRTQGSLILWNVAELLKEKRPDLSETTIITYSNRLVFLERDRILFDDIAANIKSNSRIADEHGLDSDSVAGYRLAVNTFFPELRNNSGQHATNLPLHRNRGFRASQSPCAMVSDERILDAIDKLGAPLYDELATELGVKKKYLSNKLYDMSIPFEIEVDGQKTTTSLIRIFSLGDCGKVYSLHKLFKKDLDTHNMLVVLSDDPDYARKVAKKFVSMLDCDIAAMPPGMKAAALNLAGISFNREVGSEISWLLSGHVRASPFAPQLRQA